MDRKYLVVGGLAYLVGGCETTSYVPGYEDSESASDETTDTAKEGGLEKKTTMTKETSQPDSSVDSGYSPWVTVPLALVLLGGAAAVGVHRYKTGKWLPERVKKVFTRKFWEDDVSFKKK